MNKYVLNFVLILGLTLCFIFDQAFSSVLYAFTFFSFSILFISFFANIKKGVNINLILLFFVFGLYIDLFRHTFLGISSLLSIIVLFIYKYIRYRFAGNVPSIFFTNFVFIYLLFLIIHHFDKIFSKEAFVGGVVTTIIAAVVWAR
jgi:hypothetical protein